MVRNEAWSSLVAHLESEAAALSALESILVEESAALRKLDAATLLPLARRKAEIVEGHLHLAQARQERLTACRPGDPPAHLSALFPELDPTQRESGLELQDRIRTLVRRVQNLQAMNQAYAETGRQTVETALGRLARRRAGSETTYGASGRVQSPAGGPRVREQG